MAVNPFYVKVESSTRKETVGVGMKRKDGRMDTYIHQRDHGEITTPFHITQVTMQNTETGEIYLTCWVYDENNVCVAEKETVY